MKILFVFAHPDKRSFNYSLLNAAVKRLEENGHIVKVSDLYRMKWKGIVDEDDFLNHEKGARLKVVLSSTIAYEEHQLTEDVLTEQGKLNWADIVIFQFPLWWFTMPAIMKGWFDRVFTSGYAYNIGEHNKNRSGDRYGEGMMAGKRAFCIITAGGREQHFSKRGINGDINDIIFPINHGMLFYPGFTVLPPVVIFRVDSKSTEIYDQAEKDILERMDNIANIEPINYRKQNYGDYKIPELTLKDGIEQPLRTHFDIHINRD
ncbi:similar to Kazachstania africana KAFR_0B05180 hypothetical protein [Maudiozyma barnettii]|uniref:Flavodoxin-like fold domain-containing protein n=1 Tax=Maudiozyma barnettii TaxID=61262 RepID=A0A8H2VFW1_9SACH|nr:uncharacterized protein KABA2_05S02728 [Kazachstania barnettii]CAB4254854.1 similar to Kazachstania africana KAFR_0B05180 hypothetical protein [Kazachstania barnettii]CAD1783069.1 similar to Kazachstania africana KAFR_0B05180 hypothetical protein [Kazachstania barnettii]